MKLFGFGKNNDADNPDEIEDPDADRPLTRWELLYRPEGERDY